MSDLARATPCWVLRFQSQAPDWALRDDDRRIERTFRFRNFREALAFVQRVGELAEAEGHHPDISFGWGYVTVSNACLSWVSVPANFASPPARPAAA